jgi:hypothetical protein
MSAEGLAAWTDPDDWDASRLRRILDMAADVDRGIRTVDELRALIDSIDTEMRTGL